MENAILVHGELEEALIRHAVARDDIKNILKMFPWEPLNGDSIFQCVSPTATVIFEYDEEELFITDIYRPSIKPSIFILFDIDGTLLLSKGAGREALVLALEETYGTAGPIEDYSFSGKIDPLIITDLMTLAGLDREKIAEGLPGAVTRYIDHLRRILKERDVEILPGVRDLLQTLRNRTDIHLGLATGNLRDGAYLKLERAGLTEFFPTGGFGDRAPDRDAIPREGYRRLERYHLIRGSSRRTIVIGDAPADITSARANGFYAVAVSAGFHTGEELDTFGPDLLLPSLEAPAPLLDFLEKAGERG